MRQRFLTGLERESVARFFILVDFIFEAIQNIICKNSFPIVSIQVNSSNSSTWRISSFGPGLVPGQSCGRGASNGLVLKIRALNNTGILFHVSTWGTVLHAAGDGKCFEKMSLYMYSSLDLGVLMGNLSEIIWSCLIMDINTLIQQTSSEGQ